MALYIFLIGMLFPLIGLITLSYRASVFYFAIRDSTYQAAKQQSFTEAKAKATQILTEDASKFTGIKVLSGFPETVIVVRPLSGSTQTESKTKLAANSVNTNNNVYFIRTYTKAELAPFVNMGYGGSGFINIPGLTQALPLNFSYQVYAENPPGLES